MKEIDQTTFGFPGGNCFSACVASLLELNIEDVPYFMGEENWFEEFKKWLRPRGYWAICVPLNNNNWEPEGLCILSGKSPRGDFDHSVVANRLEMIHDPHPSRDGIESKVDVIALIPIEPTFYETQYNKLFSFLVKNYSDFIKKTSWPSEAPAEIAIRLLEKTNVP